MLQKFPSTFPPNQLIEMEQYESCMVDGCGNGNCCHKIFEIMKFLPDWVEPQMVYLEGAIERKNMLGHGQYGKVHHGLFHNGNAV